MEYKGIDVSSHQGVIDWSKVTKEVDFAIIRIGYGMYENQKDAKFETNYNNAKAQGIPVGIYLYSYALNVSEAEREADIVLKWLNNRKLNLPIYYDIEDKTQNNLGKTVLTDMCKAFCNKIEKAGYWAGIYANKYWLTSILDSKTLGERYTIWVAQYNNTNSYSGKYDVWQYTSTGKVNGINGNVDMNILYRDIFHDNPGEPEEGSTEGALPDLGKYTGSSIVDGLKSVNYNSSFDSRNALYIKIGFTDKYTGSATQNTNLLNRLKGNITIAKYYPIPNYKGFSFVDALKKINVDRSLGNRTKIAAKNGITNYTGSAWQNIKLLNLLKKGQLIKA